ncbi:hypothetical protein [Chryseobacterium binzhouense]|uniref:hypothetical protein n=1 Tax=Chryseobacterium binzhouense TaxID=2593646 RepID=UPI00117F039E|nr:hypothetical protein [Chryseobacterium binzhouense]
MKKSLSLASLVIFSIAYSQSGRIGVNTETPKTTLDVNGKVDDLGVSLTTDMTGLQAPRLTRAELIAKGESLYGTNQIGALIYVTDTSGAAAPSTSQRKNVTTVGYYYFDGDFWQKISDSATSSLLTASNGLNAIGTNVKLGGALTEPTTISSVSATNKLNIIGTGVDMVNIDSNTLSVDGTNNRVAILNTTPTETLDVSGNVRFRNLPTDKATNSIYTQSNGSASATQNQTFVAQVPLFVDANGVIGKGSTANKTFTTVKYNLSTGSDEFVSNFNTNIRAADYTLIITNAVLKGFDSGGIERVLYVSKPTSDTTTRQGAVIPNIYPFKSGGATQTWSIYADYADTIPWLPNIANHTSVSFRWEITCLIIDNIFISDAGTRNITISNSGGTDTTPVVAK